MVDYDTCTTKAPWIFRSMFFLCFSLSFGLGAFGKPVPMQFIEEETSIKDTSTAVEDAKGVPTDGEHNHIPSCFGWQLILDTLC